jgi:CDGSH-type Zn-finger protein
MKKKKNTQRKNEILLGRAVASAQHPVVGVPGDPEWKVCRCGELFLE